MWVEITKKVFNKVITQDIPCYDVRETELSRCIFYSIDGVFFQTIENHSTCVIQYYVQDINS